jgi:uncharacterized membrane protein
MREFVAGVEISAPSAHVWSVMRDIERWHEWTPTIRSIERIDPGPSAVGSRVRIRQPKFPPAVWRITAIDEGRGFTWVTRAPGLRVTGDHRIEPTPAGCRVTLRLRFEGALGPFWGWLTRNVNRRYLDLEAAGLKRRSEERPG